jgi:hypothetical protein
MTVPKKPNEAKRAEISRIVRERDPQNEAQLMTIADEIPMADVLEAVGMPADVFYRLSPEQREQIGKLLVLGLAWDEALTRVVPRQVKLHPGKEPNTRPECTRAQ